MKDLSKAVGVMEKDVGFHLAFIEKSLCHQKKKLCLSPCYCLILDTGFGKIHKSRTVFGFEKFDHEICLAGLNLFQALGQETWDKGYRGLIVLGP